MIQGIVFVIDDDPAIGRALQRLLTLHDYACHSYRRPDDFLARPERPELTQNLPACLLVDVYMPGTTGLQLQEALIAREENLPLIFMSGHADVPSTITGLRRGALNFLIKPFAEADLLSSVREALELYSREKTSREFYTLVRRHYDQLTVREAEVLNLMVLGLPNKLVAARLGIAEKTVKIHRSRVMAKMETHNIAELIRAVDALKRFRERTRRSAESPGDGAYMFSGPRRSCSPPL